MAGGKHAPSRSKPAIAWTEILIHGHQLWFPTLGVTVKQVTLTNPDEVTRWTVRVQAQLLPDNCHYHHS